MGLQGGGEERGTTDKMDCVKKEKLRPRSTWAALSTVYLELTPLNSQNTGPVIASSNLFVSRSLRSWFPRHRTSDTVLRYASEKTSPETARPSLTSQAWAGAGGGASEFEAGLGGSLWKVRRLENAGSRGRAEHWVLICCGRGLVTSLFFAGEIRKCILCSGPVKWTVFPGLKVYRQRDYKREATSLI